MTSLFAGNIGNYISNLRTNSVGFISFTNDIFYNSRIFIIIVRTTIPNKFLLFFTLNHPLLFSLFRIVAISGVIFKMFDKISIRGSSFSAGLNSQQLRAVVHPISVICALLYAITCSNWVSN